MVLSSVIFVFFFLPITLIGYYLIRTEFKNYFLLAASLIFYAWGEPRLILLMLTSIVVNYLLALIIKKHKLVLLLALGYNLVMLFYFKYLVVTLKGINRFFGMELAVPDIALPLGISFFTFRAISYILDIYFENSPVQLNPLNTALYISFFPQVTMGPITKYADFQRQLEKRQIDLDGFSYAIRRLIVGLGKKMIIANQIGVLVDKVYSTAPGERTVLLAWLGAIGYLIQLYYDFSGYSDMAIGISSMFGFSTPENFDYPYWSKSIGEYWRRWHSTLGIWFKEYLYTPVFRWLLNQKNFVSKEKLTVHQCDLLSLLVVWILCGMWHGAGANFLVYGLYYCFFLWMERIRQEREKRRRKQLKLPKHQESRGEAAVAHLYTMTVVLFGQVLFRAEGLKAAVHYFGSMFGLAGNPLVTPDSLFTLQNNLLLVILGMIFSLPVMPWLKNRLKTAQDGLFVRSVSALGYILLFVVSVAFTVTSAYNPFIYFNF